MADDIPGLNQISTAFTFLMILFSVFLIGFIFNSINEPLLRDVLIKMNYTNSTGNITSGVLQKGDNLGGSYSLQYFFSSLVFGFVLNSVSQFISWVLGTALGTMLPFFFRLLKHTQFFFTPSDYLSNKYTGFLRWLIDHKPEFFTPAKYLSKEYAGFSTWLINHKPEKMIWEWELFYYNLYWGISTNALVFFVLTWFLLNSWNDWLLWLLILCLILVIISIFRSTGMGALHKHCIGKM